MKLTTNLKGYNIRLFQNSFETFHLLIMNLWINYLVGKSFRYTTIRPSHQAPPPPKKKKDLRI